MAILSGVFTPVWQRAGHMRRLLVHKKSTLRSLKHRLPPIEPIGSIHHFGDTDGNCAARFMKKSSDGVRMKLPDPRRNIQGVEP